MVLGRLWSRLSRAEQWLCALTVVLILIRIPLIGWNRAEFTDAIIQLELFANRNGYFPPVYPAAARMLDSLLGDPILAGRAISIVATSLMIPLVWRLASRWGDPSGALWAALLFVCSPVAWRWSLHAMGDALFALLFLWSLSFLLPVWLRLPHEGAENAGLSVAWGLLIAGLATLTRYQGFILLPIGVLAWRCLPSASRRMRWLAVAAIPWAGVVLWMMLWGFVHGGQFAGRATPTLGTTLWVYLRFAGSFVRFAPLAFGYLLSAVAVFGLVRGAVRPGSERRFSIFCALLFAAWLVIHSAFQSFQYRYFLPLVPLLCVLAGQGLAALGPLFRSALARWALGIVAVAELTLSTVLVLQGTRNTFADFREAGRRLATAFREVPVYSNEIWNPGFLCPKIRYWSGRPVAYGVLRPAPEGQLGLAAGALGADGAWTWRRVEGEGKVLFCWHNAYAPDQEGAVARFEREPGVRAVYRTKEYVNVPRLPDIMVAPPLTSQPEAMLYRERPQRYRTVIFEVDTGVSPSGSAADEGADSAHD